MFAAKHLAVAAVCPALLLPGVGLTGAWLCSRQELSNAPQNPCFGRAGRAPSHPAEALFSCSGALDVGGPSLSPDVGLK